MKLLHLFVFLISQGFIISVAGQYSRDFDKLGVEDGFSSNKANAIIQDKKGFIWVGTWNGLNRYDGHECKVYQPRHQDTTSISNREISALLEDHNGNIWIGTTSGLNRLNPVTSKIKRYKFQNRIISLFEDSQHFIWVGTWHGGLYKLDPESGKTEQYFPTEIVSDIHEDNNGNFWIATYNGLIKLNRKNGNFERYLPDEADNHSINHSVTTQIAESKEGDLWIGTWGGGINKLAIGNGQEKIRFEHYQTKKGEGSLASDVIYKLYYDQYDNLWIGTWSSGLNLLEKSQQNLAPEQAYFYTYQHDLIDPYSLSGNYISALCVDKSGILWVGSEKIEKTNILKNGVRRYKTSHLDGNTFTPSRVRAFESHDEIYFVGTTNEIMMFSHNQDKLNFQKNIPKISYTYKGEQFIASSIMTLLYNEKGLWAGTEDAGLILYPRNTAYKNQNPDYTFLNTQTTPHLPGNKVIYLCPSRSYKNTIWVGTAQNGFCKLTYNNEMRVQTFEEEFNQGKISDNNIRTILEDKNGIVWIGTQNGLNRYDPAKGTFNQYYFSETDTNSINDNVINVLLEDGNGTLWIGTNLGLNKKMILTNKDGEKKTAFKSYPTQKGVDNEIIENITEDDSANLWLGLFKEVIKFDTRTEQVIDEYYIEEYRHIIVARNSSYTGHDGTFYLGGENGFMSFDPDSIFNRPASQSPTLTDLLINNQKVSVNSDYCKGVTTPYIKDLELTHKDKVVTFVFSAMNYKDPSRLQYAYILEGFDDNWNKVGSRNSATYTNIKPGSYVFKVKSSDSNGTWDDNYYTLHVEVLPPWWRTIYAYIIYGLVIIALLYFFNRYSIIGAKEKGRIKLESALYEKEHELNELKSLFFTNITHEFRTPLTLILGPAEELDEMKELPSNASKKVELIKRNAQRLLRLVNQLIEFRKIEKDKLEIFPHYSDIAIMLNDIFDAFNNMADSKKIEFTIQLKKQELPAMVDEEKIEKALFNIISNAFKYTEDGGKISIIADIKKNVDGKEYIVIEIKDTGIGIAENNKEKIFERFFQTNQIKAKSTGGIGLFLSKKFVELHQGKIELDSELGKGSCFRVFIPFDKNIEPRLKADDKEDNYSFEQSKTDIEKKEEESAAIFTNNPNNHNRSQILIVEDDHELNEFIVSGLSQEFNATGCLNGKEGLALARKLNPDLIITDIIMPEMDGIELSKLLRKDLSTSHIPIIFLTAKTMHEDEVKGLKIGAVDYIYKPFNLTSLRLKIRNQLDIRKNMHDRLKTDMIIEPEKVELSDLDEIFLQNAVKAVRDNLDDSSFDVEKFSDELGVTSNQLYRKIKALTGQTAKEFIRNQRLKTAAELFLQQKRSISEIIYMVGFSSPSYFTRCFKAYFGCTPKEYIDKNGK